MSSKVKKPKTPKSPRKSTKKKRSRTKSNGKTPKTKTPSTKKKPVDDDISLDIPLPPMDPPKDLKTLINEALEKVASDANTTKDDILKTFAEFKLKLNERETRLLHDVDSSVDKKNRLLQTQLEYIEDTNNQTPTSKDIACDPSMCLKIEKQQILRTIMTAGWIEGASSDNKEEQEMQELERKRRELAQQQFICVDRLKKITLFERECGSKRVDSMKLSEEVQEEIKQINVRTNIVEDKLNEAKPLMEAAKKLVSSITKSQLNEMKSLKKPPFVVELVMSAVAVMLGSKGKTWRDIQKILANPKFVKTVLEFDTMVFKKKRREQVVVIMQHNDFNEERANKASKVAGPLVKWIESQVKYSELLDIVRPMQKEIKSLKKRLEKKQKQLMQCNDVIYDLEHKISKCRKEMQQMVDNMIEMQDKYHLDEDPLYGMS